MNQGTYNVVTSKDAQTFAAGYTELAFTLYGDSNINLGSGSRQFAKQAIAVRMGTKTVAQCVLYENPHLSLADHPVLLVGNLEAIEDYEAFCLLMQAVEDYAINNGYCHMIGPINGSTWDSYRFAHADNNPAFVSDILQKPYYPRFLERWGFSTLYKYRTTEAPAGVDPDQFQLFNKAVASAGFSTRSLTPETFRQDLQKLYPMLQRAFSQAALFSPISETEFIARYMPMAVILRPGYTLLAEDADANPVACLFGFPDAVQADRAILKTVARDPLCPDKMIARALALNFSAAVAADGRRTILHAFIRDDNEASRRRSEELGSKPYRQYRLYEKTINTP